MLKACFANMKDHPIPNSYLLSQYIIAYSWFYIKDQHVFGLDFCLKMVSFFNLDLNIAGISFYE